MRPGTGLPQCAGPEPWAPGWPIGQRDERRRAWTSAPAGPIRRPAAIRRFGARPWRSHARCRTRPWLRRPGLRTRPRCAGTNTRFGTGPWRSGAGRGTGPRRSCPNTRRGFGIAGRAGLVLARVLLDVARRTGLVQARVSAGVAGRARLVHTPVTCVGHAGQCAQCDGEHRRGGPERGPVHHHCDLRRSRHVSFPWVAGLELKAKRCSVPHMPLRIFCFAAS